MGRKEGDAGLSVETGGLKGRKEREDEDNLDQYLRKKRQERESLGESGDQAKNQGRRTQGGIGTTNNTGIEPSDTT